MSNTIMRNFSAKETPLTKEEKNRIFGDKKRQEEAKKAKANGRWK